MTNLPIASLLVNDAMARTARSALPDAPVAPEPRPREDRAWLRRSRLALAGSLHHVAELVAPAPKPCGEATAR